MQVVAVMGQLIKEGLIRAWAISNETALGISLHCQAAQNLGVPKPVCISNEYSLLDRRVESDNAEACIHYNIK